jgi:hypothetical protein
MRRVAPALPLLLYTAGAAADPPVGPPMPLPDPRPKPIIVRPAPPRELEREWYGYINVTCDVAAVTTGLLATQSKSAADWLLVLSTSTWMLGGPIAHWGHGRVGAGFACLGIRGAMPIVSGGAGCIVLGARHEFECAIGFIFGALLGVIGASAVDAGALAYTNPKPQPVRLVPFASPTPHGGTLGMAGQF